MRPAAPHSDVDFLVVEPTVSDVWQESVRLRRHLAKVPLAMDVIVVSRERYEAERDRRNTLVHSAATEGNVYSGLGSS